MLRSYLPAVLASALLVACHDVPKPHGAAVHAGSGREIAEASPIEVAVAPIVNTSGAAVPEGELRVGFHKALVGRRYSPLALSFVDRNVRDASYVAGSSQEQAALQVTVEKWDSSLWTTHGAIQAKLKVEVIDAASGALLWRGDTDRRFDFGELREHLSTEGARVQYACDSIADEVLSRLPSRVAKPGRDGASVSAEPAGK